MDGWKDGRMDGRMETVIKEPAEFDTGSFFGYNKCWNSESGIPKL